MNTGLVFWGRTKLTLLPSSGTVVLWGKTAESALPALHFYKKSSSGWAASQETKTLCEHEKGTFVVGLLKNGKDMLAVICLDCQVIRLLDVESGEVCVGFYDVQYSPGVVCLGEAYEMFVLHGATALQLDCSKAEFSVLNFIQLGMRSYYSVCYIPLYRIIVVSNNAPENNIRAVSCDSGSEQAVWEVKQHVEGVPCNPHGMTYSAALDALFVADGKHTQILVLNPVDGSLRQVLPLDKKMKLVMELSLHNDQLLVHHCAGGKVKISVFAIE